MRLYEGGGEGEVRDCESADKGARKQGSGDGNDACVWCLYVCVCLSECVCACANVAVCV